jgi:hypothetical protein
MMSFDKVVTYVTVVKLPEALPTQARRITKSFLNNGMQEAKQEIDTRFLDGRLAGALH